MWEEFKEFGEIGYVRVIRDPTTFTGKGIAYICFKERKSAKRAISKNNSYFQGRTMRVSKARDPDEVEEPKKHTPNRFNGFYNTKSLKTQSDILESAKMFSVKQPSSLKGTKKLVRREQIKLQEKRQHKKEANTKVLNKSKKKPKLE